MGGHAAWKKRVANGGLAKGVGGAIARHRPRWGRKGDDLKLNRKGNIGGGNPKKKKRNSNKCTQTNSEHNGNVDTGSHFRVISSVVIAVTCLVLGSFVYYISNMR